MSRKTTIRWLYLVVTLTTFLGITLAAKVVNPWNKKHHVKRNTRQQPPIFTNQFDIRSMLPSQWQVYAPNPPTPEEVDCHIELEVTELIGGRCVRLGGSGNEEGPAVCQSGIHLDIWNNECEYIMAARQNSQSTQQEGQSVQETSTTDTGK